MAGAAKKYELWVNGEKLAEIISHHTEYKIICTLRNHIKLKGQRYRGHEFEIFRIHKSKFPPPEEEDMSKHLVLPKHRKKFFEKERPPAEYSNHSPFKIANEDD